jgi:hypothetical protein
MKTTMMCGGRDADGGDGDAYMALIATHCCSRSLECFLWVYECFLGAFNF